MIQFLFTIILSYDGLHTFLPRVIRICFDRKLMVLGEVVMLVNLYPKSWSRPGVSFLGRLMIVDYEISSLIIHPFSEVVKSFDGGDMMNLQI